MATVATKVRASEILLFVLFLLIGVIHGTALLVGIGDWTDWLFLVLFLALAAATARNERVRIRSARATATSVISETHTIGEKCADLEHAWVTVCVKCGETT